MSIISLVAAIAENNAIGKNQQLLWHLPNDMKRFKELTLGNAIIMGRKTFESLPKGALPNRKNIVLTSLPESVFVNSFACESMDAAIDMCEKEKEIFMIGGAMIYKRALDIADKMYLTIVHHTFEDADTYFPEINYNDWEELERQDFPADEKHAYPYTFLTYVRKRKD